MQVFSYKKLFLLLIIFISLFHQHAYSQQQQTNDVDEAFDPFSDYNEFEQDAEEEADINFFRNGRYLTLAFAVGYRGFTEGFAQAYTPSPIYGVEFSYFFDLQVAATISYSIGDHALQFTSFNDRALTDISTRYTGTVNIQTIDLSLRYYFNTENVTRGLADLNPYVIGGAGQYVRTYNISQQLAVDADHVIGFKAGAGIEIPLLRHRAYLGLQATYHYVQFPDENNDAIEEEKSGQATPAHSPVSPRLNGDIYDITTLLGINF